MSTLQQYFAGHEEFVELLESVGILTLEQFAAVKPSEILPELYQAKRTLRLDVEIPPAPVFRVWVAQATYAPTAPDPSDCDLASGSAATSLPLAKPVEATSIKQEEGAGSLTPVKHANLPSRRTHHGRLSPKAKLLEKQHYHPSVSIASPQEKERYLHKKGIKYLRPFKLWAGATAILLFFLGIAATIVLTSLTISEEQQGQEAIVFCFAPLLCALLLYFSLALPCQCSVCKAPVFSFKKYARNRAAHHIFLLGYVLPTALHILLFRWFRCPACGSAQQLFGKRSRHSHSHFHHPTSS